MKHVLDASKPKHTATSLRHAYTQVNSRQPTASTLALQQRCGPEKTGASMTRQFLRIARGKRA